MELCQGIMQTMQLSPGETTLLREDTANTLTGTQATVEKRLAVTYALHDFHRKHIGTEQLQLVATLFIDLLQQIKCLVITHLLIGHISHVVNGFGPTVGIPGRKRAGFLCRPE